MKMHLIPATLILAMFWVVPFAAAGEEKGGTAKIDPTITAFFDAAQRASMLEDPGAMAALWDLEEAVDALEEAGFLASVPAGRVTRVKASIRNAAARAFRSRRQLHPFQKYTIRHVSKGVRPKTVIVYAWLRASDGLLVKQRHHLVRRDESWALYDLEAPDTGLRTFHVVGMLFAEAFGGLPAAWRGASAKLDEAQARLLAGEFEASKGPLLELETMALPDALASAIELMLAIVSLATGDLGAAAEYLDKVVDMGSGAPLQHYLRAAVHNQQSMWEEAVAEARRYIELLDAGPAAVLELAIALRALGRGDEALAALTPAVRESPEDAELLAQYANCLPKARWNELEGRFAQLRNAVAGIRLAADFAIEEGAADRLHFFAGALKKRDPGHHDVDFYGGHALFSERKFREAAARFEKAQRKVFSLPQKEQPQKHGAQWTAYVEAVLDALLAAGDPCGAYDRAHDPEYALGYLAESLLDDEEAATLRKLLVYALARPPKEGAELLSLRARYYGAEADVLDGKNSSAHKALAALLRAVEKSLEADDEIEALWMLLHQVEERFLRLLLSGKRYEEAAALVGAVAVRDGPDYQLQALLHVARGEVAKAGKAIRSAVKEGADPSEYFDDADMGPVLRGPAYAPLRRELLGDT